MKKRTLVCLLIITILAAAVLTACGAGSGQAGSHVQRPGENRNRLKIVCTVFAEYDWTRVVLGERIQDVELICLLDNGADLHSFQPSVKDMTDIADCDVFIRIGGESQEWTEDVLAEAVNPDMKVLTMLDALGDRARAEETVEGMQVKEGRDHEHGEDGAAGKDEHGDGAGHEHDAGETDGTGHEHDEDETDADQGNDEAPEFDEHVWMNFENARILTAAIRDVLTEADPEHAAVYEKNQAAYESELLAADAAYRQVIAEADKDTVVFADRFPFRYLADEYGLKYYAAFSGCSAETEAGFDTIVFLAKKMDELELGSIFVIENSSDDIARTVIANTKRKDQSILVLNSMQSVAAAAMEEASYLGIMYENLEALKTALQ